MKPKTEVSNYHSTSHQYVEICWSFIVQDNIFFGRKILSFHLWYLQNWRIEGQGKISINEELADQDMQSVADV